MDLVARAADFDALLYESDGGLVVGNRRYETAGETRKPHLGSYWGA